MEAGLGEMAREGGAPMRVAVVGAGLVGSLEACLLAQRGIQVREDTYKKSGLVIGRTTKVCPPLLELSGYNFL